jgi:flagellar basal-body rod modification protein FlgD
MATINDIMSQAAANTTASSSTTAENPKGILGKDDFMKLLLVELQQQDPTEPMDSEKILSQTSQLATLEASEKTNQALSDLAVSMKGMQDFNTVSAIGKMASLGGNTIAHTEGETDTFEIYFPKEIQSGTVTIVDEQGDIIHTAELDAQTSGIKSMSWDGRDAEGNKVADGYYGVSASYFSTDGKEYHTEIGTYPIASVMFENGVAKAKLGSSYVPFTSIQEIF